MDTYQSVVDSGLTKPSRTYQLGRGLSGEFEVCHPELVSLLLYCELCSTPAFTTSLWILPVSPIVFSFVYFTLTSRSFSIHG